MLLRSLPAIRTLHELSLIHIFQGGNDVFTLAVCIFIIIVKLDHIKTSSNYDCSVFLCNDLILLVIVNGSGLTYF